MRNKLPLTCIISAELGPCERKDSLDDTRMFNDGVDIADF